VEEGRSPADGMDSQGLGSGVVHLVNGFLLVFGAASASPVAGAGDEKRMGVVRQAVQAGRGQQRVSKQVGPLGGCAVTGKQDTPALVALVDDVIQVFRRGRLERLEPEIVQDQEVRAEIDLQAAVQGAVGPAAVDEAQHAVRVGKENVVASPAGLVGQGLRQMGLAHAGRSADQQVALVVDVGAGRQVEHLLAVEAGIEVEVKPFQGLGGVQGRPADAQAQLLLFAPLDLVFHEA